MELLRTIRENVALRRGLGLVWHLVGIALCYYGAFLLRFDFDISQKNEEILLDTLPWALACFVIAIFAFGLYRGLWRFFTFRDCVLTAAGFAAGTLLLAGVVVLKNEGSFGGYPRSVLAINYLLVIGWEVGGRGLVRVIRELRLSRAVISAPGSSLRSLLVGDFEECNGLIRALHRQRTSLGRIVGILVDQDVSRATRLHGVRVFSGLDRVGQIVTDNEVDTVVILPPFHKPGAIRQIVDAVGERQVTPAFRVLPSIEDLAAGRLNVSQIRQVEIEDLLERSQHDIDMERLRDFVSGRRVLVTGAGGSIGAEICRQIMALKPAVLVLFEVSEFHLFEIERELRDEAAGLGVRLEACAGDVRREDALRKAIAAARGIDIIYHAAAYKHVDLMERNPGACFHNNVIGTEVVARVAEEVGATDCVLVSTDKAVRPTSLMGASKRIAERILMERLESGTRFKAVRFGNVLGSSGSVVPIFREQIARGGPVTVTSPDVVRYFMTIPEAVELVLAAGSIDEDRRIFVLEMGEPVKIDTLARRMIELSGFAPDEDIPVVYTGLKPGEKEYEELLTEDENVVRTDLDRIWVVKKNDDELLPPVDLGELFELIDAADEEGLRSYAHSLIRGSRLKDGRTPAGPGDPRQAGEGIEEKTAGVRSAAAR